MTSLPNAKCDNGALACGYNEPDGLLPKTNRGLLRLKDGMNASASWIILTMVSFLFCRFHTTFDLSAYAIKTLICWTFSTSIFSVTGTSAMSLFLSYSLDVSRLRAYAYFRPCCPVQKRSARWYLYIFLNNLPRLLEEPLQAPFLNG